MNRGLPCLLPNKVFLILHNKLHKYKQKLQYLQNLWSKIISILRLLQRRQWHYHYAKKDLYFWL